MMRVNAQHLYIALASLICMGCDLKSSVSFERPQPKGQRDERAIPDKLVGDYINPEDSSIMRITKQDIIMSRRVTIQGILDSVDRVKIKRDTSWIELESDVPVYVKVVGDSVFMRSTEIDTLFAFSSDDILRKFRRSYLLNQSSDADLWRVRRLRLIKGGIAMGTISGEADLEKLRLITNEPDSIYHFDPTRREFKALMKQDGFSERIYFKQKH